MEKLKKNRAFSFIAVLLVYIIATVVGILVYNGLNIRWWLALLIADISATIVTFVFSLIFKNASVYDPYWSVQPIVILLAFFIKNQITPLGILLLIAVCFWGIRLTVNWAYTFKNLTCQDWRYTMLKNKTGKFYFFINLFGIHLVPTLVVYGCILPAVCAIIWCLPLNVGSVIFISISILSAIMQGIADIQMHKFRKNKNGSFIRNGLWKYSRHPNYLGEILMWWGIGLATVISAQGQLYLLLGALSNTALFLLVSIPMADKRQSRKEGFNEYKKQTRMLLPIYKRGTK